MKLIDVIQTGIDLGGGDYSLVPMIKRCLNAWIQSGHTIENVPLIDNEKRHDVGNFDTYYASVLELALEEATDRPQLERMLKEQLQ